MILVIIKTGKRVVATVGTEALQGSWSGGRRGNVPPKSDWSAVVYQQLAACLARPVIKYCWSSRGKKYYLQIIPSKISNSFAWFTVKNWYVQFYSNVFIIILFHSDNIHIKNHFEVNVWLWKFWSKDVLYTVVCIIATTFISILWKLKTCICFHSAWTL